MNILNRLKLIIGMLLAASLVFVLFLYLNYSMSHAGSVSAKLVTESYTVGTDYSGVVTKQYVHEGDHVTAGQPLFVIKSSLLISDISRGALSGDNLGFQLDTNGNIVLTAAGPGTVASVDYLAGSFVPANKEIAAITTDGSLYVQASYKLAPPDYARLKSGDLVTVTLPNDTKVQASVFDINVQSNGDSVQTIVKARVKGLDNGSAFTDGTPVSAELHLSGKTFYNSISESLQNLFQPKA